VAVAIGIASAVVLSNVVVDGYVDMEGSKHAGMLADMHVGKVALPLTPFTLASPSLGLLLGTYLSETGFLVLFVDILFSHFPIVGILFRLAVFRTNTSYQRWDEARKNWGSNINRTRDLVRMATSL
jgi:hypothetical protein